MTVFFFRTCQEAYQNVAEKTLSSLHYVPLGHETISIQIFFTGSLYNFSDKSSQVVFVILHVDKNDRCNWFHWHSERAAPQPASTDEAVLLAFNVALLRFQSHLREKFQFPNKKAPIVAHVDIQTLWQNLMGTTPDYISELMYRCDNQINE